MASASKDLRSRNLDRKEQPITWATSGSRLRQDQLRDIHDFLMQECRWEKLIPHLRKYNEQPYSEQQNQIFHVSKGVALLNVWLTEIPTLFRMYKTCRAADLQQLCDVLVGIVGYPPEEVWSNAKSEVDRYTPNSYSTSCDMAPISYQSRFLHHPRGNNSQIFTKSRLATQTIDQINRLTNHLDENLIIGRGQFGVVYKGQTSRDGQCYAVKRLLGSNKEREFTNATIDFYIEHDNIVRLVGTSIGNDEYFLIYEYLTKLDLSRHISTISLKRHLYYSQRFFIAQDIIRGLSFINNLKKGDGKYYVHRDIKSANIFLNDDFHAKIGDFGASTAAVRGTGKTEIQDFRMIIGTPGYMAPELLSMSGPIVTTKVDTFAFGIVVLELCCGQLINDNKEILQKLQRSSSPIRSDDSISWGTLVGDANFNVADFLQKIAKDCTIHSWQQRPLTKDIERRFLDLNAFR